MPNSHPNPFIQLRQKEPPRLFGRQDLLRDLLTGVTSPDPVAYSLFGFRRLGLSTLLRYIGHPKGAQKEQRQALLPPFNREGRFVPRYLNALRAPEKGSVTKWLETELRAPAEQQQQAVLERFFQEAKKVFPGDEQAGARLQEALSLAGQKQIRVVLLLDHVDQLFRDMKRPTADQLRPVASEASFIVGSERPLGDLNPVAFASLFQDMVQEMPLEPLQARDARAIFEAGLAEAGVPEEERRNRVKQYVQILDYTGYYPPFILLGAEIFYDLETTFAGISEAKFKLLDLFEAQLYLKTRPDFARYWRRLNEAEKEALLHLTAGHVEATDYANLYTLKRLGLLVSDPTQRPPLRPFSRLFARFLREELEASEEKKEQAAHTRKLTKRQKELLDYLQGHPNEILSRAQLLQDIWRREDNAKSRRLLTETMRQLRQTGLYGPGDIITHHGKGYEYRLPQE